MVANYTDAQRKCIESDDNRLVISAAAGTGKTFTITQKIAWMMQHGKLDDIGQVLAITFTQKAAGEIKARVRSTLRAAGMHQQALLVDGAWISTIHGMCSRMLKAHALEVGVDPGFSIADDRISAKFMERAMENVLAKPEVGTFTRNLFADFRASGSGRSTSVTQIVESLIAAAKSSSLGFDALELGPVPQSPRDVAFGLVEYLATSLGSYEGCGCESTSFFKGVLARRNLLEALEHELEDGEASFESVCSILDAKENKPGALQAKAFPGIEEMFHSDVVAWQRACSELRATRSRVLLDEAMGLAKVVKGEYDRLMAAEGYLDNDDLMVLCHKALSEHPEIAQSYRGQFKLVMVDEFQDTSQLQIDIISMIVSEDAQLCTVGDAQQSIYGFRGADVNVYDQFIEDSGVDPVKLETNFRSHGDILEFANRIFEQPKVFGNRFLRLREGRPRSKAADYKIPRASIVAVQGKSSRSKTSGGVTTDQMREVEAAAIASKLDSYRKNGCNPGDMVVLLGAMSHVDLYAAALRARGFEVVVAGGSGFWKSRECAMVSCILSVLANPRDTMALYGLLRCGIVPVGDDSLALLACSDDGRRRNIQRGFCNRGEAMPVELELMRKLVRDAVERVPKERPSVIVTRLLADSGYVDSLRACGAQGTSALANVLKAIGFVEELESDESMGIVQLAQTFAEQASMESKESPGVLMSGDSQAVRIMTIHASKGLEFPVVAVAEFANGGNAPSLVAKSYKGRIYVALKPGNSVADSTNFKKAADCYMESVPPCGIDDIGSVSTGSSFDAAVRAFNAAEELGEAKRRFYVALTRASEGLVVAMPEVKTDKGLDEDGIVADMCTAFLGGSGSEKLELPSEAVAFEYGGSFPGEYTPVFISKDPETGELACPCPEFVPVPEPPRAVSLNVPDLGLREGESHEGESHGEGEPGAGAKRAGGQHADMEVERRRMAEAEGMFSYSSISPHQAPVHVCEQGDVEEDCTGKMLLADEDDATQLGLAFHSMAEYMALSGMLGEGKRPSQLRISSILQHYALSDNQRTRFDAALSLWCASGVSRRAGAYPNIQAEVPFCMEFAQGPLLLNGEIDLLCTGDAADGAVDLGEAFIVDYKTGGSPEETPEQLHEKHLLQSLCYAYAVLKSGYSKVELAFARVEQIGEDGDLQTVGYSYSREDLPVIEKRIARALEDSSLHSEC